METRRDVSEAAKMPMAPGTLIHPFVHDDEIGDSIVSSHIVDRLNDGIVIFDMSKNDLSIIYVNQRFCDFSGFLQKDCIGQSPCFLRGKDTDPEALAKMEEILRSGKEGAVEIYNYRKNGQGFWNLLRLMPIHTGNKIRFFAAIVNDITDRVKLREQADDLRDELIHYSRMNLVAEMISSLAHELIQPLAAIASNVEAVKTLLTGGKPDMELVREIIEDIISDNRRASTLVYGLRDFLKKEESSQELIEINLLIEQIASLVYSELVIRKTVLNYNLEQDLPPLVGNRILIQQVILNLINNAMQAMADTPNGDKKILIATYRRKDRLIVDLVDQGVGIQPGREEQIFDKFYTTKKDGMGMGLAISRYIVESHGGRLYASRNPERGSTFTMELPIHE